MTVEKWLEDSVKSANEISNQGSKSNFCPVVKSKFSSQKPQEVNSVSNIEQSSKVDVISALSDQNRILYTNHKYTKLHLKSIETIAGSRGTSILGEVRDVEISRAIQQLLNVKYHSFLAVFALAYSKINQIPSFLDDNIRNYLNFLFNP